jgi:hypothetical protein
MKIFMYSHVVSLCLVCVLAAYPMVYFRHNEGLL